MFETAAATLDGVIATVRQLPADLDDAAVVTLIGELERLKAASCAVQAELAARMLARGLAADTQRVAAKGEAAVRRSVAAQIGLARRESPAAAARLVRMAEMLTADLPTIARAFRDGETNEYRVSLITQELSVLGPGDRRAADGILAPELRRLGNLSTLNRVKAVTAQLDTAAVVRRNSNAVADRTVTIRPAPDTMVRISALLPVVDGVAAYAALRRAADSARAHGDDRSRGQLMADGLVAAVTGALPHQPFVPDTTTSPVTPDVAGSRPRIPVGGRGGLPSGLPGAKITLQLVMTDRTLLGDDDTPAQLIGYGPIPAPLARRIAAADQSVKVWVKRLYRPPGKRRLVDMDSRARSFPTVMREFITARDQTCRTPFCDAPIRQIDHITPVHAGGHTCLDNSQGTCQTCNLVKEFPGWDETATPDGDIDVTTPTGHRYTSHPPTPPESDPWPADEHDRPVGLPSWARRHTVWTIGHHPETDPDEDEPHRDRPGFGNEDGHHDAA